MNQQVHDEPPTPTISRYQRLVLDAVEQFGPDARTIDMVPWIRARRRDWLGHIHGRIHVTLIRLEGFGLVESKWEPDNGQKYRRRLYSRRPIPTGHVLTGNRLGISAEDRLCRYAAHHIAESVEGATIDRHMLFVPAWRFDQEVSARAKLRNALRDKVKDWKRTGERYGAETGCCHQAIAREINALLEADITNE